MPRSQLLIFIGIGAFVLVIVLVVGGLIFGQKTSAPQIYTINFWGLEDESMWRETFNKFQVENKHLTINYTRFTEDNYEDLLINRLAEGKGPDVFLLKNTWINKHRDKLYPLPQNVFEVNIRDISGVFVGLASKELVAPDGSVLGFPIFMDTLALFYNKDIFNASGIAEAPKTWDEVVSVSKKLTKTSPAGDILRSGIALGDVRNVEYSPEILTSIIFQNGDKIVDRISGDVDLDSGAKEALDFFVSFQDQKNEHFSWNNRMPNSLDSFAQANAAMVVGFSKDVDRVKAKNPHLSFGVVTFPQKPSARASVYGEYFFPVVSKSSKDPVASWRFVLFLASQEGAKSYLAKSLKPPARRDLISQKAPTEELEVFYKQALIADNWPVAGGDKARRLFEDAISSVVSKAARSEEAISRLDQQLQLLLP